MPRGNKVPLRQLILDTLSWLSVLSNKGEQTFDRQRVLKFVQEGKPGSQANELRALQRDGCILYDKKTITILPKGLGRAKRFRPASSNQEALQEVGSKFGLSLKARQVLQVIADANVHTIQELHRTIGPDLVLASFKNIITKLVKWELCTRCKDANHNDAIRATDFIFPKGRPTIARAADEEEEAAASQSTGAVQEREPHEREAAATVEEEVDGEFANGQVTEESSEEDNGSEGDYVNDWAHYGRYHTTP